MRNYLLTLTILFTVSFTLAQGPSRGSADDERLIRVAHLEDFPGAEKTQWSKIEEGYEVSFVHNGYSMIVRYSWNSALIYQEFVVPPHRYADSQMSKIFQYLDRQYSGYSLRNLFLCDAVSEKFYRAEFSHRNRSRVLRFDLDGSVLID